MSKKTNITPEIRSISSPDIEFYSWEPATLEEVFFLVEMEIGEKGVAGADLFQVVISTPEGLRAKAGSGKTILRVRSTIVVSNYDWNCIRETLELIVRDCEAESWVHTTLRLQRYFKWEYEDFQM
jgi:hypothetical protein